MGLRGIAIIMAVLVLCIIQVSSDVEKQKVVKGSNRKLLPLLDCDGLCKERCRVNSRPNVCTRACGTCCVRCQCVPPGTSGNREICGTCYTEMTTHANKTKCP